MQKLTKVRFEVCDAEPVRSETLWAEHLESDLYRLRNAPFFAKGVSEADVVRARRVGNHLCVTDVARPSGNVTIRLYFACPVKDPTVQHVLRELNSIGAWHEQGTGGLVAVTIPPGAELPFSQISNFLNGLTDKVLKAWDVGKWPASPESFQSHGSDKDARSVDRDH